MMTGVPTSTRLYSFSAEGMYMRMQPCEAKPNGVAFVGIDSQDLTEDALAFAEDYGLTYPLVHDDGGEAGRDYGVSAFPETFVLDAQGRAVAWFPGEVTAEGLREAIAKAGGP